MVDSAKPIMKTMILLGINGGFGNTDVASLQVSAIDLEAGVIDFPRPKTGVDRRVPLWDATAAALREALDVLPQPASPEFADQAFLTVHGNPWVSVKPDGTRTDSVVLEFRKLLKRCGIYRPRTGFYWLRHTFQTVADEAGDPIATAHVMGHADGTIGGVYRERISDERLRAVVETVRRWLFSGAGEDGTASGESMQTGDEKSKQATTTKPAPVRERRPTLRVVG
ncbi:MAG: tyrosine-type recombinase/integrase [Planctomycetaceae bacterium]|nr:tyrosine-type recombinase/integrase [Planctomycetaceae bacterium]